MDQETLRSGSAVSEEAKQVLITPAEKANQQRTKFLGTSYTQRVGGKEYPWNAYTTTSFSHRCSKIISSIQGYKIAMLELHKPEDYTKFVQLMGRANRSPRMSLTNLFKTPNITVYVLTKGSTTEIRVGVWVGAEYIGVSTTNHD